MTEHAPFQILALDAGGAKALFTAHVLARLEDDLDLKIADSFDFHRREPLPEASSP